MDEIDYKSEVSHEYLSPYLENLSIGLHSSCYINDNPMEALKKEIEKFTNIYNFKPKFLTLHGLGTFKFDERMKFIKNIAECYADYDILFADFITSMRSYDYVIQDCHLNDGKRYLKNDIIKLPPMFAGSCYLFLAHPCYWDVPNS